jgi:hypothetical protein
VCVHEGTCDGSLPLLLTAITAVVAASDYSIMLLHARFNTPYYYGLLYTQAIPSFALISVGQPRLASRCSLTAYNSRGRLCVWPLSQHPSINQLGRASGTPVFGQPTAISYDRGQQPAPNHWLLSLAVRGDRREGLPGR